MRQAIVYRYFDTNIAYSISGANSLEILARYQADIAAKVRELRQRRRWTQAELAERLELSQSRLSEIERGGGSFTAEQFLLILQLFNASVSDFVAARPSGEAALQNALARLGATHLQESDEVVPSERLAEVNDAVQEALVVASPRLLTALGPVLVSNADRIGLRKIHRSLAELGLERRLCWLAENVREAIDEERRDRVLRSWQTHYLRARLLLDGFVESVKRWRPPGDDVAPDFLDRSIRSDETRAEAEEAASSLSHYWGIISTLQPEDFARALRAARAAE